MSISDTLRLAVSNCGRSRYRLAKESHGELSEQLLSGFMRHKTDLSLRRANVLMELVGLEVSIKEKTNVM